MREIAEPRIRKRCLDGQHLGAAPMPWRAVAVLAGFGAVHLALDMALVVVRACRGWRGW